MKIILSRRDQETFLNIIELRRNHWKRGKRGYKGGLRRYSMGGCSYGQKWIEEESHYGSEVKRGI